MKISLFLQGVSMTNRRKTLRRRRNFVQMNQWGEEDKFYTGERSRRVEHHNEDGRFVQMTYTHYLRGQEVLDKDDRSSKVRINLVKTFSTHMQPNEYPRTVRTKLFVLNKKRNRSNFDLIWFWKSLPSLYFCWTCFIMETSAARRKIPGSSSPVSTTIKCDEKKKKKSFTMFLDKIRRFSHH